MAGFKYLFVKEPSAEAVMDPIPTQGKRLSTVNEDEEFARKIQKQENDQAFMEKKLRDQEEMDLEMARQLQEEFFGEEVEHLRPATYSFNEGAPVYPPQPTIIAQKYEGPVLGVYFNDNNLYKDGALVCEGKKGDVFKIENGLIYKNDVLLSNVRMDAGTSGYKIVGVKTHMSYNYGNMTMETN